MKYFRLSTLIPGSLLALALTPAVARHWEACGISRHLTDETACAAVEANALRSEASDSRAQTPAFAMRVDEPSGFVASWQTVGGCGAGSGGGSNIGLKWIGRNVHGGLFNVQQQSTYTKVGQSGYPEYNFFFNTLITRDLGEKWIVGTNLPFAYKYLTDPQHLGGPGVAPVDYSNSGFGDMSLLVTRRFGRINDMSLTGTVGLPTGEYKAKIGTTQINQSQQIGFGRPTFGLTFDKTFDEVWGLWVLGGSANYRGGKNDAANYRAPSGSAYSYIGYFLGPLVPAFGISVTGYTGHDRDQDTPMSTPLASFAANASLEWSSDWIAVLVAGSYPYGYHGSQKSEATDVKTWRALPWTVSLGIAVSPF
jgi:hypothetical protein